MRSRRARLPTHTSSLESLQRALKHRKAPVIRERRDPLSSSFDESLPQAGIDHELSKRVGHTVRIAEIDKKTRVTDLIAQIL
jgi:hypothetical protein